MVDILENFDMEKKKARESALNKTPLSYTHRASSPLMFARASKTPFPRELSRIMQGKIWGLARGACVGTMHARKKAIRFPPWDPCSQTNSRGLTVGPLNSGVIEDLLQIAQFGWHARWEQMHISSLL